MAEDGRFFAETDPEWAVSRLAAEVAAGHRKRPPRSRPRLLVSGALLASATVAGVTSVQLLARGSAGDPTPVPVQVAASGAELRVEPVVVLQATEPRVTLGPAPERTFAPPPPPPAAPAPSIAPPPQPMRPTASAKPPPGSRDNVVGPKVPVPTAPIDPDDR